MVIEVIQRLDYLRNLESRKTEVTNLIEEQEKLTEKIAAEIKNLYNFTTT